MLSQRSRKVLSSLPLFVIGCSLGRAALAQPPAQVVDLNTSHKQPAHHYFLAEDFAALDGDLYFTADDGIHGIELWKTGGAGAALVKDVCPGACGAMPQKLTRFGSRLLFFADDGEHGRELWATDGTAAGTVLVKDIQPGLGSSTDNSSMLVVNGTVFFPADDGAVGYELWKSDGTASGTVLVKDLRPGPESSRPAPHVASGGTVLFDADDGVHGQEPWLTDGTASGTRLLKDIRPDGDSTFSVMGNWKGKEWMATTSGLFLFQADDGVHGAELWASDGTEAGTILVQDFYPGAEGGLPIELTEFAGAVYFTVATDTLGWELWKTDGTPAGTSLVKDIYPGNSDSFPWEITVFAGRLVFGANDGTHGRELWTSDGTAAGTTLLKDVAAWFLGTPQTLTVAAGQLFFFADDGTNGKALWKTDGTEAGTVMVSNFGGQAVPSSFSFLFNALGLDDRLYFRAFDLDGELDLWASDGTAAGTVLAQDGMSPTSSLSLLPRDGTIHRTSWGALGEKLIYLANDGDSGEEPWVSDGTAAGTQQLAETRLGLDGSFLSDLTPLGTGSALFSAPLDSSTYGLWKTDGTPAGTSPLFATGGPTQSSGLIRIGATVYFSGFSTDAGQELWKTDGTAAGTSLVKDIRPGPYRSDPLFLTAVGSTLFFVASSDPGYFNQELWKSDGSLAGTVLVKDIRPGEEPSAINHVTVVGGRLFFSADDGTSGREPWASDGTAAGTFRVKDIVPGPGSSMAPPPYNVPVTAVLGSTFFFVANDGASGEELWASDGTEAGTRQVKDVRSGARGSEPRWLTVAGGRLFFTADDGPHGRELWTSDGTEAGTVLVADLLAGSASSLPRELAAVGNAVIFSATDGANGVEPWASNGDWTRRLGDLAPGDLPSSPVQFTPAGSQVYFGANDGTTGFELWAVPKSALEGPLDFYTLPPCRLADTRPSAPLSTSQTRTFPGTGSCGIPAEARALAVNITAVASNGSGHLVAWPAGTSKPEAINVVYPSGVARSGNGVVWLGSDGQIDVQAQTFVTNGQVHFVLDVTGYFR